MPRLWRDMSDHRTAASVFLISWLALWGAHGLLGWFDGIPAPAVWLHLLAPVVAAGLVGWWRASAQAAQAPPAYLRGGLLAALLVVELDIAVLFFRDGWSGLRAGKWAGVREWFVGWFLEWVEWSVIIGLFALVLGLFGGWAGAALARRVGGAAGRAAGQDPTDAEQGR